MTELLPYIFNIPSLILGLYLLVTSFKIYRPKFKTEEQSLKYDNSLEKFGTLRKIVSVILTLKGAYGLINPDPDRYKLGATKQENGWGTNAKTILIEKCLKDSGPTAIKYPKIGREYCECSTEKIMSNYTEEQYLSISQKSRDIQIKELIPKFQGCVGELKRRTDSTDRIMNRIELEKQKRTQAQF
ncbi:MAG: hypothetical protein EAZ91_11995 [Cytophagales bacterium]|nr:MAG: hypothetical protein EAZ91_11995 [Cytophagales bacterium]